MKKVLFLLPCFLITVFSYGASSSSSSSSDFVGLAVTREYFQEKLWHRKGMDRIQFIQLGYKQECMPEEGNVSILLSRFNTTEKNENCPFPPLINTNVIAGTRGNFYFVIAAGLTNSARAEQNHLCVMEDMAKKIEEAYSEYKKLNSKSSCFLEQVSQLKEKLNKDIGECYFLAEGGKCYVREDRFYADKILQMLINLESEK